MQSSASNVPADSTWQTVLWAVIFAGLFASAFPPYSLWPVVILAPVALTWLALRAERTGPMLGVVFGVSFVMWLWMQRFIIDITMAGYPLLAAYLAVYPVLYAWLVRRVARHRVFADWPMTVTVPVLWVGLEMLRGEVVMNGYPWFLIGHPLIEWPIAAQVAELIGAYGVSVLVAVGAGAIVDVVRYQHAASSGSGSITSLPGRRVVVAGLVVAVCLHGANLAFGVWRMADEPGGPDDPVMLAVQTNLPQDNKLGWSPEQQVEDFQTFVQLTAESVHEARASNIEPDLVLWPETMLPGMGLEPQAIDFVVSGQYHPPMLFPPAMEQLQSRLDVPLLVGTFAYIDIDVDQGRWQWDEQYNSAYLVDGRLPYQRYDKVVLTPFGETMPYISNWPWLEEQLMAIAAGGMSFDLDAGDSIEPITVPTRAGEVRLVTPICFEITVSSLCRRMVYGDGGKRADVLVNLSNDGWFGSYDGGRAQHAQLSRWRAIENRVPVVRSVNTGHSLVIDSRGVVRERLGEGAYGVAREPGAIAGAVPLDDRVTLYSRIGNLVGWTVLAAAVIIVAAVFLRHAEPRKDRAS